MIYVYSNIQNTANMNVFSRELIAASSIPLVLADEVAEVRQFTHDALTQLHNRSAFDHRLALLLAERSTRS